MNGLTVFQIKVHNKYSAEDFDEDLRQVLRRSGRFLPDFSDKFGLTYLYT